MVTITVSVGPLSLSNLTFTPDGELMNLDVNDPELTGADLTFKVKRAPGGDGLAHVGTVDASGIDLANVTVKGDLSRIFAGDSSTAGNKTIDQLTVRSLGVEKIAPVFSDIVGPIGMVKIKGDINGARLFLHGAPSDDPTPEPDPNASIGQLLIKGSIIGGSTTESGSVQAEGSIALVKIGRDSSQQLPGVTKVYVEEVA